ncbi:SURF1 family cytochrome oxidase biogenesis protein [Glutamicibacter sp. NPDC087344]|uniref:SURF1 family cytochrome oxidase biogenesis protein n=1 Tax=Glutamicibacter sp. NPDC087344 TaxID=3363994 RepID=UPI003826D2F4
MLKTALKPQWLLALLAALALATGFVALSGWQFGASESEPLVKADVTEVPVPLIEHHSVGTELLGTVADQIVSLSGEFVPGTDELIAPRLHEDIQGVWVVSEFLVDGAPDEAAIAVVRGWQPDTSTPSPAPEGELNITGRLLPSEGPELKHDVRNPVLETLASSQLANLWDHTLYEGFITAHELTAADGAQIDQPGLTRVVVGPQPQEAQINWLNVFYGIEWVVFAGFALFLWYRMVRDDYQRSMEAVAERAAQAHQHDSLAETDEQTGDNSADNTREN